jgi:ATP-dependent Clp protease ATP-binding subunit ClpC
MTSNVGAEMIKKNSSLGFTAAQDGGKDYINMKEKVLAELKKSFRPEFLNRIDESIVFHSLDEEHILRIVSLMAEDLRLRLKEQEIDFALSDEAKKFLAKAGFDPTYGARPLRRAIQKHIEDHLSEELLKGTIAKGDSLTFEVKDGELVVLNNQEKTEEVAAKK